jgi:protein-tyrosine kinase
MNRIITALARARQGGSFGSTWLGHSIRDTGELSPASEAPDDEPEMTPTQMQRLVQHRVLNPSYADDITDAYRILRTQVLRHLRESGHSLLAVTSPGIGEGKSLTAINLAMSLILNPENRVLLVDCNLRRPQLHNLLGVNAGPGLSDYLTYDMSLNRLVVSAPGHRLAFLPAGRPIHNSAEMLASQKMRALLRILKNEERGRFVIFDLPAVLPFADMLAFAPLVEAVLLVVEEGKTQVESIVRAGELLANANLIGTVLNKSATGHAGKSASGSPARNPAPAAVERF